MKLRMIRKVLLFLGMAFVLLGPGAAFSAAKVDASPIIFMDGPLAHALEQMERSDSMEDCAGMESDMNCSDCDLAACTMAGCGLSFLSETAPASWVNASLANAPGAPPMPAGLSRHNLPLPPP